MAEAAARTGEAVKKLPGEKPLAEAAAVFAARSKALAAEVTTLDKALVARKSELDRSQQALRTLTDAVAAARARAQPVRDSVRRQESLALEARRKAAASRTAHETHLRRLAALEAFARRATLRDQAQANRRDIEAARNPLATAEASARASLEMPGTASTHPPEFGAAVEQFVAVCADRARRDRSLAEARAALRTAEARGQTLATELADADDELAARLGERFAMAGLKPLSPEQMCWSILEVTGVYDRTARAARSEIAGALALAAGVVSRTTSIQPRPEDVEALTDSKLRANVRAFISVYGSGAGQPQGDFFATADQALFATNGGSVNAWIAPSAGNISDRMTREPDPRKAAEDLYLTVLSRPASDAERDDVARMLTVPAARKPAVVQQLVWGLLTSAEFRFNH